MSNLQFYSPSSCIPELLCKAVVKNVGPTSQNIRNKSKNKQMGPNET